MIHYLLLFYYPIIQLEFITLELVGGALVTGALKMASSHSGDIAQLYLRALSHNFRGRVLSIVSDCSYSGCWVRDCMEFLDEQGVQPCGHKAREKGMIIKVLASCKSNEIPTKHCFSKWGMENKGILSFLTSEKILETQTTDVINPSFLNCTNKGIDEPCTLPPDLTWKSLGERSNTEGWLAALAIQMDKLSI